MQSFSKSWRVLHWVIIINFAVELVYASYMVFFVLTDGISGPLFSAAKTMPFEQMMVRRQYALEFWIAAAGLSLYLGLTEILPRRLARLRIEEAP